jgi:hypothetical protein
MQTLIYPAYLRILERNSEGWCVYKPKVFYNPHDDYSHDFELDWKVYGVSKQKLVVELFCQFGGKLGYYLANLRDKKYYYCGLTNLDIQKTLYSLGIGIQEGERNA